MCRNPSTLIARHSLLQTTSTESNYSHPLQHQQRISTSIVQVVKDAQRRVEMSTCQEAVEAIQNGHRWLPLQGRDFRDRRRRLDDRASTKPKRTLSTFHRFGRTRVFDRSTARRFHDGLGWVRYTTNRCMPPSSTLQGLALVVIHLNLVFSGLHQRPPVVLWNGT